MTLFVTFLLVIPIYKTGTAKNTKTDDMPVYKQRRSQQQADLKMVQLKVEEEAVIIDRFVQQVQEYHVDEQVQKYHVDEQVQAYHVDEQVHEYHVDEQVQEYHVDEQVQEYHVDEHVQEYHVDEQVQEYHVDEQVNDTKEELVLVKKHRSKLSKARHGLRKLIRRAFRKM